MTMLSHAYCHVGALVFFLKGIEPYSQPPFAAMQKSTLLSIGQEQACILYVSCACMVYDFGVYAHYVCVCVHSTDKELTVGSVCASLHCTPGSKPGQSRTQ